MGKRKTKEATFTDDDDALLAELGVETEIKQDQTYTAKQERIIAGFEDIQRFYREHERLPQHGDCLQRSPVRSEELGRGQAWSVGHGWHRVSPVLGWFETAFGMHTHEPCGLNGIKPISAAFSSLLRCFFESPSLAHVRICRVRLHVTSLGVSPRPERRRMEAATRAARQ